MSQDENLSSLPRDQLEDMAQRSQEMQHILKEKLVRIKARCETLQERAQSDREKAVEWAEQIKKLALLQGPATPKAATALEIENIKLKERKRELEQWQEEQAQEWDDSSQFLELSDREKQMMAREMYWKEKQGQELERHSKKQHETVEKLKKNMGSDKSIQMAGLSDNMRIPKRFGADLSTGAEVERRSHDVV